MAAAMAADESMMETEEKFEWGTWAPRIGPTTKQRAERGEPLTYLTQGRDAVGDDGAQKMVFDQTTAMESQMHGGTVLIWELNGHLPRVTQRTWPLGPMGPVKLSSRASR